MRVLVLQHHPDEGPGTLGEFLQEQGAELKILHTHKGEEPPVSPDGFNAVVSMGGPMNVYEEDRHPWLKRETQLLATTARAGLPIMGICLGAQMLAKALGARVVRSPEEELGWYEAKLTQAAAADPLWAGVEPVVPVVQWHGDMFEVPEGGRLLARGEPCPHQAFGWEKAYGLQFHVEVTPEILQDWFSQEVRLKNVMEGWGQLGRRMDAAAKTLYANFGKLMETR